MVVAGTKTKLMPDPWMTVTKVFWVSDWAGGGRQELAVIAFHFCIQRGVSKLCSSYSQSVVQQEHTNPQQGCFLLLVCCYVPYTCVRYICIAVQRTHCSSSNEHNWILLQIFLLFPWRVRRLTSPLLPSHNRNLCNTLTAARGKCNTPTKQSDSQCTDTAEHLPSQILDITGKAQTI